MTDNTTSEGNKTMVHRVWKEVFIQGNLDAADESCAPRRRSVPGPARACPLT